jgi:hypothetical protein
VDPPLPPPPPTPVYAVAPSDIYPRSGREVELCAKASRPDYLYLGSLVALDIGALWFGSSDIVKFSSSVPLRTFVGPGIIGATWGATVTGAFLALPKCEPHWVGETPREGDVRTGWPLAIALALLAGATAPIVNAVAIGYNLPIEWSTPEREAHLAVAGVAGFAGALVPYLLPPTTLSAARELDKLRFGYDGRTGYLSYVGAF